MTTPPPTERCEWNPKLDIPASDTEGCPNEATFLVGVGMNNLHLCGECAFLRRFKRRLKRKLRKARQEGTPT